MMSETDINKRSIGVNFLHDGTAEIKLWAPLIEKVEVLLTDNNEKITLTKNKWGFWFAQSDKLKKGDKYKFVLDEQKSLPDPASLSQLEGVHGPSGAIDSTQFDWNNNTWNNLPLEEYIIYELHTGTFTPQGTFKGIEEKLNHLVQLGITAIEIMPVAQFAGTRNWGYDGVYPFAVQSSYGGAEGLQKLVNACHQKGIAVILDVVYNHLGPEGAYHAEYGPYYTDKYKTPWGGAINFDDEWCDGVRHYFIENAVMWFRDFRIDALRLDAVHAIKDFSATHILKDIKVKVDELMAATGRRHYLIVESDLNDTRFINSIEKGGFGMDAQWIDEFHHALRITAGGESTGYYADFNGIGHLAKAYKDAYVYDGQFSPHRKKKFGIEAAENGGEQFVIFSQNHDQVGNRMLGERTSVLVSFEMQKLLACAVLISPFLPMLFMGEEWSEPNPFQYFVSHTDPGLAEAVRRGRKQEFAAFHAAGEAPDPMAEKTFEASKLQWNLLDKDGHKTMFDYYCTIIHLRKANPVLRKPDREKLSVIEDKENKTLVVHRWQGKDHILAVMNFSGKEQIIHYPSQITQWKMALNSAHLRWGGNLAGDDDDYQAFHFKIQPESIIIFTSNHV